MRIFSALILVFLCLNGKAKEDCATETGITLPPKLVDSSGNARNLPDPKCNKTGDEKCAGWKFISHYEGDQLLFSDETDPLFTWENEKTLCLTIFRQRASSHGFVRQVACYNKANCAVCAYSDNSQREASPTGSFEELTPANKLKEPLQNCSACHATGPLLIKAQMFNDLKNTTASLSKICAQNGGPKWGGNPPSSWTQPSKDDIVKAPESCASCHANFVKRGTRYVGYCKMLEVALNDKNGSMHARTFSSHKEQRDFVIAMGCPHLEGYLKMHEPSKQDEQGIHQITK